MITNTVATVALTSLLSLGIIPGQPQPQELSSHQLMLNERVSGGGFMSDVMSDNILLTLGYLNDEEINPTKINWDQIRRTKTLEFRLNPKEVFAFHEDILPEYSGKVAKTTNAHFNFEQGFKSDGYLMGDGVCHLASLINWVAQDANLKVDAPTNHDFMPIPGIDRKYGTAIFYTPYSKESNARQNLYITNDQSYPVLFKFVIDGSKLEAKVFKLD